jgi:hypothetical protein
LSCELSENLSVKEYFSSPSKEKKKAVFSPLKSTADPKDHFESYSPITSAIFKPPFLTGCLAVVKMFHASISPIIKFLKESA